MRRWIVLVTAVVLATAAAQAQLEVFTSASMAYRIGYPADWVVQAAPDDTFLDIQPPASSHLHGQVAIYLALEPDLEGTLEQAIEEALAGMRGEMPDLRVLGSSPATIAGRSGAVVDVRGSLAGHTLSYRLAFVLDGGRGFVLMLQVLSDPTADDLALFDQVLASFAPSGELADQPPLVPGSGVSFAGTFVGDGLTLTLEAVLPGVHYVGTLQHGDARYAIVAQATATGLAGTFESAGQRFEFAATPHDGTLTFVTGGVSYALTRLGMTPDPDPCNPLVPGSCGSSAPPIEFPFDLEAPSTGSGTVGVLVAPGTSARGRLAGRADGAGYHTYVVEVPDWLATLVLELDATVDLDLAAKFGSDIQSYAPRAQGGDWDVLDVGTANPTVLVIENPQAGRWFVDVINQLGEGRVGSYELHVRGTIRPAGGGGGMAPTPTTIPPDGTPDVPDPCSMLALLPGAAVAGPPPGIAVGTRLVYYGMTASIPGVHSVLVQDDRGDWVDPSTGRRWSPHDVPGSAASYFEVRKVDHLDAQLALVGQRVFHIDLLDRVALPVSSHGTVSHAGCAGGMWVHPQALASLPDMDRDGTRVLRTPFQLGERVFDAIRIHTTPASGFTSYVYDLGSGLLLYTGASALGASVPTLQPGGGVAPGGGSTLLVSVWLQDVQQTQVPWRDAPAPAWVAQFGQIDYAGTRTMVLAGVQGPVTTVQQRVSVVARGPGWVQVRVDSLSDARQGTPPVHEQAVMAHGPGSVGGLWIAPEALARLTEGQVIEHCAVVGITTSVSAVSREAVMLSEFGPQHRRDLVYDTRSGVLVRSVLSKQQHAGYSVVDLQLVDGPR